MAKMWFRTPSFAPIAASTPSTIVVRSHRGSFVSHTITASTFFGAGGPRRGGAAAAEPDFIPPGDPVGPAVGPAIEHLVLNLPPKERACVLLKDVFEYSLEEIAELVDSTVGGVKAALNRGRSKLASSRHRFAPPRSSTPENKEIFRLYVERFNRRDWDGLRELISADAGLLVADRFAGRVADAGYFGVYRTYAADVAADTGRGGRRALDYSAESAGRRLGNGGNRSTRYHSGRPNRTDLRLPALSMDSHGRVHCGTRVGSMKSSGSARTTLFRQLVSETAANMPTELRISVTGSGFLLAPLTRSRVTRRTESTPGAVIHRNCGEQNDTRRH